MATQTQTQEGVEHGQPRHRRRAKERPDAFENQFSKLSETSSSTQQNKTGSDTVVSDDDLDSTVQEAAKAFARMDKAICGYLAEACRKFDHAEFNVQTLAQSHEDSTVSDWADEIDSEVKVLKSLCITGFENPEAYLKITTNGEFWAEAEVLFNQSMNQARYSPQSGPVSVGSDFLHELCSYCNRNSVLIADLLPELVELNQFDPQMQAVLRRRWTSIDSIMDGWYRQDRKDRCAVPHWAELSQIFKQSATNEEDQLPARLSHVSSALWLSLLVFVMTVPTTALGWRYSPHQPGTTQDADFWFLIQSSCMTILSFAVLAIPIWRTETFSVKARFWVWGLLIAAALCVAVSPLIYVFGPTEWSQFMSIVSGIVQVFLTLQIALVADHAGKGGGKSGKKDK